jgi:hypothetical protein
MAWYGGGPVSRIQYPVSLPYLVGWCAHTHRSDEALQRGAAAVRIAGWEGAKPTAFNSATRVSSRAAHVASTLVTDNEEGNPMYQLNLQLGFRFVCTWLGFERTVM